MDKEILEYVVYLVTLGIAAIWFELGSIASRLGEIRDLARKKDIRDTEKEPTNE